MEPAVDHAGDLLAAARTGDRRAVGRLLSLAERAAADPRGAVATGLAEALRAAPPNRPRVVGVTGPPGAGKSTLVGALVHALRERNRAVWVLAVDPSSPVTGGALLGDRLRMAAAGDSGVVVRSLASRGTSGGLAAAVPWAVRVAAALGADDVVVETVGSGQADVAVTAEADVTVLAVPPGLGDEVQASKAGIAEVADIVCVTKGDRADAVTAARQWRAALGRGPGAPRVVVVSALAGDVSELTTVLDSLPDSSQDSIAARPAPPTSVDPALVTALTAARRAAGAGLVTDSLVHLGEALRLGRTGDGRDPVTAEDLRAVDGAQGLARLVDRVSARLLASEIDDTQG